MRERERARQTGRERDSVFALGVVGLQNVGLICERATLKLNHKLEAKELMHGEWNQQATASTVLTQCS